jgi:hypothetical protein
MEAASRVFEHAMILLGTPVTSHMGINSIKSLLKAGGLAQR